MDLSQSTELWQYANKTLKEAAAKKTYSARITLQMIDGLKPFLEMNPSIRSREAMRMLIGITETLILLDMESMVEKFEKRVKSRDEAMSQEGLDTSASWVAGNKDVPKHPESLMDGQDTFEDLNEWQLIGRDYEE